MELVLKKAVESKFILSADINGVHQEFKKPFKDVESICKVLSKMVNDGKVVCKIVIKCVSQAEYELKDLSELNLDFNTKEGH